MLIADVSEVIQLAADIATSPDRVLDAIAPVVEKGALNIKTDARRRLHARITRTYLPHYGRAIDYDIDRGRDWMQADIGPRTDMPQGAMGPGVEFGSSNTAPIPHLLPAHEDEVPRLLNQAGLAVARSIL